VVKLRGPRATCCKVYLRSQQTYSLNSPSIDTDTAILQYNYLLTDTYRQNGVHNETIMRFCGHSATT